MALIRSITTVGGYTMASRVLGFARDVLIARVLGTSMVADAFFVGQRFPNLFRSLFAEGAFNSSFVPIFAGELSAKGPSAARAFGEQSLAVLLSALLIFTLAAEMGMPWLMHVIAPGFAEVPEKFELAVRYTRITFPYLLFMSLTALQGGILNSLGRYGSAAAAPIMLNVVMIAFLIAVVPFTGLPGEVLSWAVALAGFIQFFWLVISCHRAGMDLHLPRPHLTPLVRRQLRLMLPGILGSGVMQINLTIGTIIATLHAGAVSYLYYADRIYQLPLAVIGSAVGVVLLPELVAKLRADRSAEAMATLNRALEFALLMTVPAAVALLAIPKPIVVVLFEHGIFTAEASVHTAAAVVAYSLGLPAYVLVKALTPGFFAREDTATPFRFAIVSVITNIVLSVSLYQAVGFVGIALATALASWLNAIMLAWRLHQRRHLVIDAGLKRRAPRIILASLLMGLALGFAGMLSEPYLRTSLVVETAVLSALILGGIILYFALALAFGAVDLAALGAAVRRRS